MVSTIIVEKLVSRAASPPISRIRASTSVLRGCREDRTRSAPRRALDCSRTADWRFRPREPMATSAAMPSEMLEEKSSSLRLEARESRQAIRQVQEERSAVRNRTG